MRRAPGSRFPSLRRLTRLTGLALACAALGCAEMAQTAAVLSQAALQREQLKQRSETLQGEARFVQVVASGAQYDQNRQPVLRVQLRNGSRLAVSGVALLITYLNGQTPIAQDQSCAGPLDLGSGQSTILTCRYSIVRGSTGYRVDVARVQFR